MRIIFFSFLTVLMILLGGLSSSIAGPCDHCMELLATIDTTTSIDTIDRIATSTSSTDLSPTETTLYYSASASLATSDSVTAAEEEEPTTEEDINNCVYQVSLYLYELYRTCDDADEECQDEIVEIQDIIDRVCNSPLGERLPACWMDYTEE